MKIYEPLLLGWYLTLSSRDNYESIIF